MPPGSRWETLPCGTKAHLCSELRAPVTYFMTCKPVHASPSRRCRKRITQRRGDVDVVQLDRASEIPPEQRVV
eukprot:744750-Prymnesium_polylepis.2